MSGPKYGKWSVETNVERERRIEFELRESIKRVENELDAVRGKWQAASEQFGDEFSSVPTAVAERASEASDNDTLRAILQRLRSKVTSWKRELAEAESLHRTRALLASTLVNR